MRLNVKATPYCATCEFWDDVGRTVITPTFDRRVWDIQEKERRMCLKKRIITKATSSCFKYESKLKGL